MAPRREVAIPQRFSGRLVLLLGIVWCQLIPAIEIGDQRRVGNQVGRLGIEVQIEANCRETERTEGSG